MSSFSWTCRRLLMITVAACSSSLYTDSVNTASQFKSLCQELPRLVSRSRSWRQLSRHSVIVQQWELPSNVHVRYQEYIITRVSNLQYPRRNTVYCKVTWLPVYCTWASGPDCRGSTRLAVSNLGYFPLYLVQHVRCFPRMVSWSISAARLLLMTFALDHAPSKYIQIKQSTDTFTAFFSRAVHQKSRYFVHSVSTRVLEVRYSCYYVHCVQSNVTSGVLHVRKTP